MAAPVEGIHSAGQIPRQVQNYRSEKDMLDQYSQIRDEMTRNQVLLKYFREQAEIISRKTSAVPNSPVLDLNELLPASI